MRRACGALAAAAWWIALVARLVWWLPSLALARLWDGRLRFRLALVSVGLPAAAGRVFAAEAERAGRRMRALRERRG